MNKQQKKWAERLQALMAERKYRPMKQHELLDALQLKSSARTAFRSVMHTLDDEGAIERTKNNRWALPAVSREVEGSLTVTPAGFGFVAVTKQDPEKPSEDVFIPRQDMGSARHGDIVIVRVSDREKRPEENQGADGRIVKVLKRGKDELTGILMERRGHWSLIPDDPRISGRIKIEKMAKGVDAQRNHYGVVQLDEQPDSRGDSTGTLTEILGPSQDPEVEILALMRSHELHLEFSDAVVEASKDLEVDTSPETLAQRMDLRGEVTVTIDPHDAKDFDDALSVHQLDNGNWRLGVHIADVSHYVPKGGTIDLEAVERATSTYLVDRVVTMLPENLTNRICSLVPNEDRLTHSVLIELDEAGNVVTYNTAETVIHSDRRFAYEEAQDYFETGEAVGVSKKIKKALDVLRDLAKKLRQQRMDDGAMSFNVPEIKVILEDDGSVKEILKRNQKEANQLVEEFMLLANRLVGTLLSGKEIPSLYRIHEEPSEQQWQKMSEDLAMLGIDAHPTHRGDLEDIAIESMNHNAKLSILIAILKNLNRAEYSAEVIGHFGLAFERYSHFTSPIRRYPDLIVHRILKAFEKGQKTPYGLNELGTLASHCSTQEREAEAAEKESIKIKLIRYYSEEMARGNIGPFKGYVTAVIPRGLLIELSDTFQRGLLAFQEMGSEYYEIDRNGSRARGTRSGKIWMIGDSIDVDLLKVDRMDRRIDFRQSPEAEKKRGKGKGKQRSGKGKHKRTAKEKTSGKPEEKPRKKKKRK